MKPLRLVMQAFGPYAERQELDFRTLSESSLFLIHGPTGGGKTTILDAMCFALYGGTSGDERQGREMRSDHADPSLGTEVTFDFKLGKDLYRITRSPEQERPKKRGEGMTVKNPEATFWKIEERGDGSFKETEVIESKWSKVTSQVESLLGFHSDQFRQVIMLPQGQFRKLLLASSKEREEILEVLFQTELYRRIEEALKTASRDLTRSMEELSEKKKTILEQADAEKRDELEDRRKGLQADLKDLARSLKSLREKEKKARESLEKGRSVEEKFTELEEAEDARQCLIDTQTEFHEKKEILKLARNAVGLRGLEDSLSERVEEVEELTSTRDESEEKLEGATVAAQEAREAFDREKKRENEREALQKKLNDLGDLKGKIALLEEAVQKLADAREEENEKKSDRDGKKEDYDELIEKIAELEKAIEELGPKAEDLKALKAAIPTKESELEQRKRLEIAKGDLKKAEQDHKKAETALKNAETVFLKAKKELGDVETLWRSGQAGILAETLKPDEPCPVCGSKDHPVPAERPEDVPDEQALNDLRQQLEQFEAARDHARTEESKKKSEITRLEAEIRSITAALKKAADVSLDEMEEDFSELKRREEEAATADERLKKLKGDLKSSKSEQADVKKKFDAAEKAFQDASGTVTEYKAVVDEKTRAMPEGPRTQDDLGKVLVETSGTLQGMKETLEAAEKSASETSTREAGCKEALKQAKKAHESGIQKLKKAESDFNEKVLKAGFPDKEAYENAKMEDEDIEDLDNKIQEYDGAVTAANERLTRARQSTREIERPDLEKLEVRADETREACEKNLEEQTEIRTRTEQIESWLKSLDENDRKLKALETEYFVIGKISDVANGKNHEGITFQRFVLAALLDDVLVASSERLQLMSKGRFHLQRVKQRADLRIAGGLDLEVSDMYTGTTRPVKTLSGGESFLASLSLALGLADVVQAYAGGIHMETIFVDEGFGTLDPESLDQALKALIDLQEGGRLVGIISHVPELKERIDVRLEVSTTRRGSAARFVNVVGY